MNSSKKSSVKSTEQTPSIATILKHLTKLAGSQVNSRLLPVVGVDTLNAVFDHHLEQQKLKVDQSKGVSLFTDPEVRDRVAKLVVRSEKQLNETLAHLSASIDPERRQLGQCIRSGLQFLADEFQDEQSYPETHRTLHSLCTSHAAQNLEQNIEANRDIEPDFVVGGDHCNFDRTLRESVPPTHTWWP